MKEELRKKLTQRFPENLVKQRKGSFGKMLNYLEANAVVERLNDVFEGEWTYKILSHETLHTGEVLVLGRLEAAGIIKEAFGRGNPAIHRESGEVLSMVDAYKSAVSDSIKRCARLLGVGSYLYSDDIETEVPAPQAQKPCAVPANNHISSSPAGTRLTVKQLSAIWALARKCGHSSDAIRQRTNEIYGSQPEHLSKSDASDLIGELALAADKRGAA